MLQKGCKVSNYSQMYKDIDAYCAALFEEHPYLEDFEKKAIISLREVITKEIYQQNCDTNLKLNLIDIVKIMLTPFRIKVRFTKYEPVVIAFTTDKQEQKDFAKLLNYPIAKIKLKRNKSFKYFLKSLTLVPKIINKTFKTYKMVQSIPYSEKINKFLLYAHLVKFYSVYYKTEFNNIKTILTANTCYKHFPAVVAKAEDCGVNIVKIAYFITNIDNVGTTRINAKYCFALDKVHEEFYKQFEYNKDVKFLGNGGRLSSDFLYEITQKEKEIHSKKQIVYLTGHSITVDFDNYYVGLLKNFVDLHEGYELIIKSHPHDKRTYEAYLSENVRVERVFGHKYFEMAYNADFVFSLFSSLSYQTKLINPNCYVLGFYDTDTMKVYNYDEGQQSYAKYLEVIDSEEMLNQVLLGEHKTTSCEEYIKAINPDFGHVAQTFKKLIEEL